MEKQAKMEYFVSILILFWIVIVVLVYLLLYGSPEIESFISRTGFVDDLYYIKIIILKFFQR